MKSGETRPDKGEAMEVVAAATFCQPLLPAMSISALHLPARTHPCCL